MNSYDKDNVFAKILRGEIPCKKFYEDQTLLCFEDIAPAAPVHLLAIPKLPFNDYNDFITNATPDYISAFFKSIGEVTKLLKQDFRLITNNGGNSGQTVFHFHVHILAGKKLSSLL